MPMVSGKEERLLTWVYFRSLTTKETNASQLWRKNVKVLWLGLDQYAREAATKTRRVAKINCKQERIVWKLKGYSVLSFSLDISDNPLPFRTPTSTPETRRTKGKGSGEPPPPSSSISNT
ncbi:hypothetical protein D1007_16072 [Hordeum vulgare]|nr:hypothetical protein D1007_16072 [Hordeum vulgare]